MPELPDVEVFKHYLDSTALYQKISSAEVKNEKVLGDASARELERALGGKEFESTRRHGKYLLVELDGGGWLLLHFGMTGYLKYFKDMEDEPPHDRFLVTFDNGFHLAFDCQRMLGKVDLVGKPGESDRIGGTGPGPAHAGLFSLPGTTGRKKRCHQAGTDGPASIRRHRQRLLRTKSSSRPGSTPRRTSGNSMIATSKTFSTRPIAYCKRR